MQPKSLKEICFRKAENGKQLPSPSSESAVVTTTSVSLVTSPTADIVGLVSDVQKSVRNSGISHFWVKPETQTPGPASEAALAAAAQAPMLFQHPPLTMLMPTLVHHTFWNYARLLHKGKQYPMMQLTTFMPLQKTKPHLHFGWTYKMGQKEDAYKYA